MPISLQERRYLQVAMPLACEGILLTLLSSADIIMAGFLSTNAIAAVSIFNQPRMVLLCVARSFASALSVLIAQRHGQKRDAEGKASLRATLIVSALPLLLLHGLLYWHLSWTLQWMGAEADYLPLALAYGKLAVIATFISSMTTILQAGLLGFGHSRPVMIANVQGNIVNVGGNAFFMFGFDIFPAWGIAGIAMGTICGAFWSLGKTLHVMRGQDFWSGKICPPLHSLRDFWPVFASIFSEQGCERLGMVLYTRMVAELGAIPYAVHAICMNFCDFYYSFAGGMGKASMILTGHAHGAKDNLSWQQQTRIGLKWAWCTASIACIVTWLFRADIFQLYTHDLTLLPLGSMILILVAVVSFPEAQSLVAAGILRGSGQNAAVAVYSFVSITFLRPLVTFFFLEILGWGLLGAWLALAFDQTLRASCAIYLLYRTWKGNYRTSILEGREIIR